MPKRSGKFYNKNEKEIMIKLGLKPTIASGSGWVQKEDGENDHVLCQLKSTEKNSATFHLQDFYTLEKNSQVAKKLPLFVLDFIHTGEQFLLVRPSDIVEVVKYIETGDCTINEPIVTHKETKTIKKPKVKSDPDAKRAYFEEKERERNEWLKNYKRK
jgi:hypothetical protein